MAGWRDLLAMLFGWHSSPGITTVAGPYRSAAGQVYSAGMIAGQLHSPGQVAGHVYSAGNAAGQIIGGHHA